MDMSAVKLANEEYRIKRHRSLSASTSSCNRDGWAPASHLGALGPEEPRAACARPTVDPAWPPSSPGFAGHLEDARAERDALRGVGQEREDGGGVGSVRLARPGTRSRGPPRPGRRGPAPRWSARGPGSRSRRRATPPCSRRSPGDALDAASHVVPSRRY